MNREAFRTAFDVSRETMERLDLYAALLQKWSRAINLMGPTETDSLWERHIADSGQLVNHAPVSAASWLDLGTGAGLPGLVVATMLQQSERNTRFVLLDADKRKAAFLREASRQMSVPVEVVAERAEDVKVQAFDVVSSRAYAPLPRLMRDAVPFVGETTTLLLHKGRSATTEIEAAKQQWSFDVNSHPSITDPEGAILQINNLSALP